MLHVICEHHPSGAVLLFFVRLVRSVMGEYSVLMFGWRIFGTDVYRIPPLRKGTYASFGLVKVHSFLYTRAQIDAPYRLEARYARIKKTVIRSKRVIIGTTRKTSNCLTSYLTLFPFISWLLRTVLTGRGR